jgi:hypothetical protein
MGSAVGLEIDRGRNVVVEEPVVSEQAWPHVLARPLRARARAPVAAPTYVLISMCSNASSGGLALLHAEEDFPDNLERGCKIKLAEVLCCALCSVIVNLL